MKFLKFLPLLILPLAACNWDWDVDWPVEDCPPAGGWGDMEFRARDTETGGTGEETGGTGITEGDPLCYPENEISFSGGKAICKLGTPSTTLEMITDDLAFSWGVTDYLPNDNIESGAALSDFHPVPSSWEDDIKSALPGVVTYEQEGEMYVAYFGKACCPRDLYSGSLHGGFPTHEGCQNSKGELNNSPSAFCLSLDEDLGICVFPCENDEDCPDPVLEKCDHTVPNPNFSGESGVCRFRSMGQIPTPEEEIGMSLMNSFSKG